MGQRRVLLPWMISSAIGAIPTFVFSYPAKIEELMLGIFKGFPSIKNWGVEINHIHFLFISFLGIIMFVLTNLGRFQEYKIHIDAIAFCRRQLNLFKYFSYMSMGYVLSFGIALYANLFFNEPDVKKFFFSVATLVFSSITFFLCFLLVKVFILEEILDHLKLDEDLDLITVDFPEFRSLGNKK